MKSGSWRFSEADEQCVTATMGRAPQGVVGVAARDAAGNPSVIINLPLVHDESDCWQPFPTLYWLVDQKLCAQIAEIERKGGVGEIEAMLEADEELMRAHLADNVFYARARWALLNEDEKKVAEQEGFRQTLEDSGVGGVANHASVKCLHAHLAFHLARNETGTTVGRLLKKQYGVNG